MEKISSKEYLKKIIEWHFKQYGKMPDFVWMFNKISKKIILKKDRLDKLLSELVEEKYLIQKHGKLFLNPNRNFSSLIEESKNSIIQKAEDISPKKSIPIPTPGGESLKFNTKKRILWLKKNINFPKFKLPKFKDHPQTSIKNIWITPIKILLLIIGTGATYMSIFYSYKWLLDFLDPIRAFMLALIMVIFAVISFELIILFRQRKQHLLVFVFSTLWLIVTCFSMTSTVAGQYNSRIEKLNDRYKKESSLQISNKKNIEYNEQKKEYQDTLKMLRKDSNQIQLLLSQYKTKEEIVEGGKIYNRLFYRRRIVKKEIGTATKLLRKLRNNKTVMKQSIKNAPDFYVWISILFSFSPLMIQFWLSVFPALFIDIIAPLSFAIVMFINVEEK